VKGSRYIEIAKAGHSAYFESPVEFNAAVLRFLDEA
jgi:pimeloyl-ACP methyl ester carboxylesterase